MREIFENKEKNILFINDLKRVRYTAGGVSRPAASGSGLASFFSPQATAGVVSGTNSPVVGTRHVERNAPSRRQQDGEHATTDTLVTTVRSFEELHQVTKGQGYEGVMTPEVFRALSQGKEVQIKIDQKAPERVNMLTPMVTAVMALIGGLSGAAYNEKLMMTIGNDTRKAAEFVRKFGTNYDFGVGTGSHIDRTVEFSVKDDDEEKKKEKNPEMSFDWRDWNYSNEERPRGNNLTVANNFDRRAEYQQVEYPAGEEQYIPPYLDKSINTDNPTVNNAVKMSQLLHKLNNGEELSTDDQDALKKYAGVENISDLKNLEKMKTVLTKIKTDIGTIPEGDNKASLTKLVEDIDKFNSTSVSSHRISDLESKLSSFGDKSILSEDGEKALRADLNNIYKGLVNDLKAAGVDVSGLLKNGTVDLSKLSKLLTENKQIPEPLKANIIKALELSDKSHSIMKRTEEFNAIPEYNESIAEDENFTPELREALLKSGLDISVLKTPQGDLDTVKVFKFAALLDDLKTGKVKIENVTPAELKKLAESLIEKPELSTLKSDLETLGMNVNVYEKERTNEQEFVEILKKYPGIMTEGYAYDKLGSKDKLTGKVASGLDVYGTFDTSKSELKKSVEALHSRGQIPENDPDFQKVLNSVDGKVLVANGKITQSGQMTIDFLKLAAKAGIISQSELDSAISSKDGKKLAQLFLKTELKLHNEYGLKMDGQLGAEHMTDITHALRNKAQQYTTTANLFMDFYSTGENKVFDDSESQLDGDQNGLSNKQMLIDLISQNKDAFIGKEFGGIKFDPNNIEQFLTQILTSEKGATQFLSAIKGELQGIQKTIKESPFKDYGQATELIDDIDFVITGTKQRDGRVLAENPNSGIDAMINYVDKTDGIGTQQGKEITGEQYLEQISKAIDGISQVPKNTPIKLGERSFENKDEALKFLYKEYQKVILSGVPIKNDALSPEKMADKFVNAFTDTSAGYDDIRETISLLGEANNRSFDFKSHNITVNNTTPEVMKKQVKFLPEETLPELKDVKALMNEMIANPENSKNKVDALLTKMKEAFQNVPNDTKGEELAKMYLAMAEKLIKKAEGKGPTDPPDLTELFSKARVPQKDGSIMGVKEAFELAIRQGQGLIKTTAK